MPRRYNDVKTIQLAAVRPGMVIVVRKVVEQITHTADRVEIRYDDMTTTIGPADAGIDVLSSSVDG